MKNHSDDKALIIVAQCRNTINAHLIQELLESEGIASVIHNSFRAFDNRTIDVLVCAKDCERACQLIHTTTVQEDIYEEISCPFCGSTDTIPASRSKKLTDILYLLIYLLIIALPSRSLQEPRYKCNHCKKLFEKK